MVSVIEQIDKKEVAVIVLDINDFKHEGKVTTHDFYTEKVISLARIGEAQQWVDGTPPVFGPDERKWIIFEHLTPFTRATVYDTAVWLGKFYSEEKVKLARRWTLLPLPAGPGEATNGK